MHVARHVALAPKALSVAACADMRTTLTCLVLLSGVVGFGFGCGGDIDGDSDAGSHDAASRDASVERDAGPEDDAGDTDSGWLEDDAATAEDDAGTTPGDAGGAPPGSSCVVNDDCADGVCRVSRIDGESRCYARCSLPALHLCEDGSECFGYCRGEGGPGAIGDSCVGGEDCLPGLACVGQGPGVLECQRVCDDEHLDVCEPGTICESVTPEGGGFCEPISS